MFLNLHFVYIYIFVILFVLTCFSLECCIRKVNSVNRGTLSPRLKNKGLEFKARCVHDYKKTRVYIKQNCAL